MKSAELATLFFDPNLFIILLQYYTLPTIYNDNEKLDMWARRYSQTVNTNLCPYFEWWGWPLTADTKAECSKLPAWTQDPLSRFAGGSIGFVQCDTLSCFHCLSVFWYLCLSVSLSLCLSVSLSLSVSLFSLSVFLNFVKLSRKW